MEEVQGIVKSKKMDRGSGEQTKSIKGKKISEDENEVNESLQRSRRK